MVSYSVAGSCCRCVVAAVALGARVVMLHKLAPYGHVRQCVCALAVVAAATAAALQSAVQSVLYHLTPSTTLLLAPLLEHSACHGGSSLLLLQATLPVQATLLATAGLLLLLTSAINGHR
jgi:hypothetical protein